MGEGEWRQRGLVCRCSAEVSANADSGLAEDQSGVCVCVNTDSRNSTPHWRQNCFSNSCALSFLRHTLPVPTRGSGRARRSIQQVGTARRKSRRLCIRKPGRFEAGETDISGFAHDPKLCHLVLVIRSPRRFAPGKTELAPPSAGDCKATRFFFILHQVGQQFQPRCPPDQYPTPVTIDRQASGPCRTGPEAGPGGC